MLTLSSMSQEQARAVKPDKAANQSKALAPPAGRDSPERRPQNAPAPLLLAGERKESGIEGRLERRHVALRLRFRWRCRIHPRGQRREQHDRQRRQIKSSSAAAPPVPASRAAACWWCHRTAEMCHVWTAPALQEKKNLTFLRIVRVQPCIRPLNAAVLAAGPDVIR